MKLLRLFSWIAVAMFWSAPAARAVEVFVGELSNATVSPPNSSVGTGEVAIDYDPAVHTLWVDLSFTGLTGLSTVAHIHCCVDPPGTVAVAVPFTGFPAGVTAGDYAHLFDLTSASSFQASFLNNNGGTAAAAEAALLAGMQGGRAYVVVHTTTSAGGEIRAFLVPVLFRDGFESANTSSWSLAVP